jgi:hypothetical protein
MSITPVSNVHPLKPHHGIFPDHLRRRLEESVKPHTEKPDQAISSVEQALCVFLVEVARKTAIALGKKLSQVMSGK